MVFGIFLFDTSCIYINYLSLATQGNLNGAGMGEGGEHIPTWVQKSNHFFTFFSKYMTERISDQATTVARAQSRDSFVSQMHEVRAVMDNLDLYLQRQDSASRSSSSTSSQLYQDGHAPAPGGPDGRQPAQWERKYNGRRKVICRCICSPADTSVED